MKFEPLPGVKLAIRTDERGVVALLVVEGSAEPIEVARLDEMLVPELAGADEYQAWLDAITALFERWISKTTGVQIKTKRRAPRKGA